MNLNPAKTAFLFPGQGSQELGMGRDLTMDFPIARATFALADVLLDFSLSDLAWDGPDNELNDTINTQPAILVHSVAALRAFWERYPDFIPAFVAGHSMGELTTLLAAGVLPFEDVLSLARTRGELMKRAGDQNPGGMAALLGLDILTVDRVCAEASTLNEIVQVANDNCPGQVVVSGSGNALRRMIPLAQAAGAKKIIPLMVSIAAHSPLMSHAQEDFNKAVETLPLQDPKIPIIGNVTARPLARVRDLEDDLKAQLTSRVRWTETIEYMVVQGVDTFIEIGPGSVLINLVKRIARDTQRYSLGSPEDFHKLTG
ncbi:MAG: ACP S-malonyltransferase [Anaerolineales bacterium]|nr:ACP S-malonyltransferase [Anaerolineales bacterium]